MNFLRIQLADGTSKLADEVLGGADGIVVDAGRVAPGQILLWTDDRGRVWLQLKPRAQVGSAEGNLNEGRK